MRFPAPKRLAATLGFMAIPMFATACGGIKEKDFPKQQAETICDLIVECGCYYDPAGTKAECVEFWVDQGEALREYADLDQLKYDDQCAEDNLNDAESQGCGATGWEDGSCSRPCKVYYGPVPSGGTCTAGMAGLDNCAQGLSCVGGICVNPCEEPSWPSAGESCWHGMCDDDSYCYDDEFTNPTCMALPTNGLPCAFGQCAEGSYCDPTQGDDGTCTLYQSAGLPCDMGQQCQECLVCDSTSGSAVCTALPGEGMACLSGQCDAGLHCNPLDRCESDVCFAWTPSGDGSGGTGTGTGGTDGTGTDTTDSGTTGGGGSAACDAYGNTFGECLMSDPQQYIDSCNAAVDGGYGVSTTCGETYEAQFQCLGDLSCDDLQGQGAVDCTTTYDVQAACG